MNPGLRETLARMHEAEAVEAVAVVDIDGLLVASFPENNEELESLAASASGLLSFMTALGSDTGLGDASHATIEYENGRLVLGSIDTDAFVVVLASNESPLGQVRLILRRYRSELSERLNSSLVVS